VDTREAQTSYRTQVLIVSSRKDKTESSTNQPTIEVVVERLKPFGKDSEQHVKLVEAIGNFIVVDMQPLSVVENKGF